MFASTDNNGKCNRKVVLVDGAVDDHHSLLKDTSDRMEVIFIGENGLTDAASKLLAGGKVADLHIVAHGAPGLLRLGSEHLDLEALGDHSFFAVALSLIFDEGARIALWACSTAAGPIGQRFIDALSSLTGAEVLAAQHPVGARALGGTWDIGITAPFSKSAMAAYPHTLPTFDFTGGTLGTDRSSDDIDDNQFEEVAGGVTMTVSLDQGGDALIAFSSSFGDMTGFYLYGSSVGATTVTVSFDTAIDINSFAFGNFVSVSSTTFYTATPIGGGTSITITHATLQQGSGDFQSTHLVEPTDWTGITGFTLTFSGSVWWPLIDTIVFDITPPTIALSDSSLPYTENDGPTQIDSSGTVSETADSEWDGGTLVVQITADSESTDQISISDGDGDGTAITVDDTNIRANTTIIGSLSTSGGTVTDDTALTITFNSNATNTIVQEVLQSLRYSSTSEQPSTLDRTVTVTATDAFGASASDTRTISVTSVDDPVELTGTPADATVNEDVQTAIDLSAYEVADAEDGSIFIILAVDRGTIADIDGDGVVSFSGFGDAVIVTNSGTSSMTLQGTPEVLNEYLNDTSRTLFTTDTDDTDTATLVVTAGETSNAADGDADDTIEISVTPVNDAPTVSGLPSDISFVEDFSTNLPLSSANFSDVDSNSITVTITASEGTFGTPADGSSDSVVATRVDDTTITLVGAPDDIDSYLDTTSNISWTPAADDNGSDTSTFTITANDGDGSGDVSLGTINADVTAVNDAATIGGDTTGALSEDTDTLGGTLNASDVDNNDDSFTASNQSGSYGSLNLLANGDWIYDLDEAGSDVQGLNASDTLQDSFTIESEDGTNSTVTITINGVNDAATIGGDLTGSLGEDDDTVSGTATATDADNTDDSFTADTITGTYGDLTIDASGNWSYDLDTADSDVQALNASDTLGDTISIQSADGTTQDISITINGANDAATISGDTSGSLSEDTDTLGGSLTSNDVDSTDDSFTADTISGTYGELTIDANGNWSYDLDTADSAVQALNASDTLQDSFTIESEDGTSGTITITINGANDAATIGEDTTGSLSEDTDTLSGTLTAIDVDNTDDSFTASNQSGSYGSLNLLANGDWIYDLDEADTDVQGLNASDTLQDSFTIESEDGTSGTVTITINGANDAATISGDTSGSLSEDTDTLGGTLTASDVDNTDDSFTASNQSGSYGSLNLLANGDWIYDLDEAGSDVQGLNASDTLQDSFTIESEDGTNSTVTITINGVNDAATIGGDLTGSLGEDNDTVSGTATATDADNTDDSFTADTITGTYGDLTIDASGNWSYDLDTADSDVQALNASDTLGDTISIQSADGTTQDISITINGANDAATISGDTAGSLSEDTDTLGGKLNAVDVDNTDDSFTADTINGIYGDLTIDASGNWSYDLDTADSDVQGLNASDTLRDSFAIESEDGTSGIVTITISGTNDAATIGGDRTGSLDEDTDTLGGTLNAVDVDNTDDSFTADTINGIYGDLTIDASGNWSYDLDTADSNVQALNASDTLQDSFTIESEDGTSETITITINGVNDIAMIAGDLIGSLNEDDDTVGGTATVTDVDNIDDSFTADTISGTYGDLTIDANGNWSYDLDSTDSDVQGLNAGDTLGDTISIQTADGTTQNISITINGANDAATISGDTAGSLSEDTDTLGGTLNASDVDNTHDSFMADTISGTYGDLIIDANGNWSYDLDTADSAVQGLNDSDTLQDSFTIESEDGTSGTVTITINGTNDAATIGGDLTGSLGEDDDTVGGTATTTDADNTDNIFTSDTITGTYGDLIIDANGNWSYDLDSTDSAIQALNAGDTIGDTISIQSADGTSQNIAITISGTNDAATISGDLMSSLSEDTDTLSGTLNAVDTDNTDDSFAADTISGTYGTFNLAANGEWTYDLDEAGSDVQALNALDTLQDSFAVESEDGTNSTVTITINGVNDAPTATNGMVTIAEETSHTFTEADFSFVDVDTGNSLTSVRIDTLTLTDGTLTISGTSVGAGDEIAVADIAAGNLIYTPNTNAFGDGLLNMTFSVGDGTDFANSPSTFLINVTDVVDNRAPSRPTLSNSQVDENDMGAVIGTLMATDPEGGAVSFSIVSGDGFIVEGSDQLRLADDVFFDFETQERTIVEIAATDDEGATTSQIFFITINDVAETQSGSVGADTLEGQQGDDRILAGDGDDTINGGAGADTLRGDDGDDRISGGNGDDISFAGPDDTGNDTVEGNRGDDIIGGGAGNDLIIGGAASIGEDGSEPAGDDTLFGGSGDDIIVGGSYDTETGTAMPTGDGKNIIWSGDGDDSVFGDSQSDTLGGGRGNDKISAGPGDDIIFGGGGATESNDTLAGEDGNDTVFASQGDDVVLGGNGDDTLFGGADNDTVDGGDGNDDLWAGGGDDVLSGGLGADRFIFGATSGNDTVLDFDPTEDTIDLTFAPTDFVTLTDVISAASETTVSGQAGTLIDLGQGNSVFIVGLTISDFATDNVIF